MKNDLSPLIHHLNTLYSQKTVEAILDHAINRKWEIYFLNNLTSLPQALTPLQLTGIKKFNGINILLETGQTYQIGLELPENPKIHYQEIYFADLIVNKKTLELIKKEFGSGGK